MNDKHSKDRLVPDDSPDAAHQENFGSYRTNSFFELYNNQSCIKNDLTRKPRTSNSFNRSEEDEESNLNDEDDLNFDDLDDLGKDPEEGNLSLNNNELSNSEEDEQDDKFDEDENNENDEKLNSIPINQRYRKNRSKSRIIHEDELGSSFKQYAKSLPVNIPQNWKPFSTNSRKINNHREDDDLDWFSVKENPENIAESIKALAKSVRDDGYELFGELPSRKFNPGELVNDLVSNRQI